MSELNEQLLPCPFCGSAPVLKRIGNDYTKTRAVQVKCSNVECRVERTDKAFRNDLDWLESVAIKNWNRRATPAPQAAPSGLTETQQYRTGYGEALRKAAVLCDAQYLARVESGHPREASTARVLAEKIRNLQSAAPVAAPQAQADAKDAQGVTLQTVSECLQQTLHEAEKRRGMDWIEYNAQALVAGIEAVIGDIAAATQSTGERDAPTNHKGN